MYNRRLSPCERRLIDISKEACAKEGVQSGQRFCATEIGATSYMVFGVSQGAVLFQRCHGRKLWWPAVQLIRPAGGDWNQLPSNSQKNILHFPWINKPALDAPIL